MHRVYIETSVWGMVAPGQNPVLQEPTIEFLEQCERGVVKAYISDVVANEIRQAPPVVQAAIEHWIARVKPVELTLSEDADRLAQRLIEEGVVPQRRLDDPRHVACALVNGLDMLISWNHRHLANTRKADAFNAVAVLAGMDAGLEIHTPLEVWNEQDPR